MELRNALLPHQAAAVEKLIRIKVGALFMEQGTGKTITALEMARIRMDAGKIDAVIWLCPCSAKGNIRDEIIKHCPEEMLSRFTICGIETLSSSVRTNAYLLELADEKRCQLVVDEGLLVKNPHAKRSQSIERLSRRCPYRLVLNGTPISRNEADLYEQFRILDWRILGYESYWSFERNHITFDDYGRVRSVHGISELVDKIAPYTYQVTKDECLELPKKRYERRRFSLTPDQDVEYDYAASMLIDLLDERKPATIYRLFSALQAVTSGKKVEFNESRSHFETEELFEDPADNPRYQALLRVLTDEKAIIFCHFESEVEQLCGLLDGAVRFDGSVSHKDRASALKTFRDEARYLVANKNCAGYSLNLQFCHRIIYFSNDWDLGTRLQSEDRVHRIGQENEVTITDLIAADTLDERISECLWRKEGVLDALKSDIEGKKDVKAVFRELVRGRRKDGPRDCPDLEDA